jgi:hypothetical protein
MMKRHFSLQLLPLCLGDHGRLVLTQMEILVRYGYHKPARDLFWHWFGRFPCTSWLHQELVLIYTAGALNVIQEELMELKVTLLLHLQCRNVKFEDIGCWKKHVVPMLRSCKTKLLLLKSILLRCLSNLTQREDFRRDLNNALTVCQMYLLIHKKVDARDTTVNAAYYSNLYFRLRWNDSPDDSPHLRAFLWPMPRDVTSFNSWFHSHHQTLSKEIKVQWMQFCQQETPRMYADVLFTYLTGALFFDENESNRELIQETQTAYIKATAGRHHRIAILTRLLVLYDDMEGALLPVDPSKDFTHRDVIASASRPDPAPSTVHPHIRPENLTGALTVQRRIDEFTVDTMRDSLSGFRKCDLGTPDKFCTYLRRRDSLMDVHLDVGLRLLRFAKQI